MKDKILKSYSLDTYSDYEFVCLTGSRAWGYNTEDSDYDYKGVFTNNIDDFLGLHSPRTHYTGQYNGNALDAMEFKQFVSLLLKGNCNAWEYLYSPFIHKTSKFGEFISYITNDCKTKHGIYRSYRGLAAHLSKYKDVANDPKPHLYHYRPLMALIHYLRTGDLVPNILELNKIFNIKNVDTLLELRQRGGVLNPFSLQAIWNEIDGLFKQSEEEYNKSDLPVDLSEEKIEKVNEMVVNWYKLQL